VGTARFSPKRPPSPARVRSSNRASLLGTAGLDRKLPPRLPTRPEIYRGQPPPAHSPPEPLSLSTPPLLRQWRPQTLLVKWLPPTVLLAPPSPPSRDMAAAKHRVDAPARLTLLCRFLCPRLGGRSAAFSPSLHLARRTQATRPARHSSAGGEHAQRRRPSTPSVGGEHAQRRRQRRKARLGTRLRFLFLFRDPNAL
jgi:hypothetical protein